MENKREMTSKLIHIKKKVRTKRRVSMECPTTTNKIISNQVGICSKFKNNKDTSISESSSSADFSSIRIRTSSCPLKNSKCKNIENKFRKIKNVRREYRVDKLFIEVRKRMRTLIT